MKRERYNLIEACRAGAKARRGAGTFYLSPAAILPELDEYAAGYEGNVFVTRDEAEGAIEGLRSCGTEFDVDWVIVERTAATDRVAP